MNSTRIELTGSRHTTFAARLDRPAGTPRAYALFACFTGGEDAVAAARIARTLTTHGIAVLRFDVTGADFHAARHPKSFVAIDGADHLLTDPADAEFVATVLAAWAGRYVVTTPEEQPAAERKQWPLENVTVELRHSRVHAEDCADCETKEGRLDRIDRTITFAGDLDDAQRRRLLEIADKCPVHRTLRSEVQVVTTEGVV